MLHLNLGWIAIEYVELLEPSERNHTILKRNNTDLQKKNSIAGESINRPGLTALSWKDKNV
jgi:hypothetical protein